MSVPPEYLELDLYEVLGAEKTWDAKQLRKAYLSKALRTHPDKGGSQTQFQQVSFAWSVLSDETRRSRYDRTGSVSEGEGVDELFEAASAVQITPEMIEEHRKNYVGSAEERKDVIASYKRHDGNLDLILETVLHAEVDNQKRIIGLVEEAFEAGDLKQTRAWKKTSSKSAQAKRVRAASGEAKEAEEMQKELGLDGTDASLVALIRKRQESRLGSVISRIEEKYKVHKPAARNKKKQSQSKSA